MSKHLYKILESTCIVKRSTTVHRRNAIKSFVYVVLRIQIWIVLMQSHKKYKASSRGVIQALLSTLNLSGPNIIFKVSTAGQKI